MCRIEIISLHKIHDKPAKSKPSHPGVWPCVTFLSAPHQINHCCNNRGPLKVWGEHIMEKQLVPERFDLCPPLNFIFKWANPNFLHKVEINKQKANVYRSTFLNVHALIMMWTVLRKAIDSDWQLWKSRFYLLYESVLDKCIYQWKRRPAHSLNRSTQTVWNKNLYYHQK